MVQNEQFQLKNGREGRLGSLMYTLSILSKAKSQNLSYILSGWDNKRCGEGVKGKNKNRQII